MKRFFLSLICALLCSLGVMAEEVTLSFTNVGANASSTNVTRKTNLTLLPTGSSDSYTFNYYQGKKQGNAIFLTKSAGAYISNNTPIPGSIKSVKIYINSGAAGATTYHCAFNTSECTSAYNVGSTAVNITGGNNHTFTNSSVSGAQYFCISLGNANNGQVLGFDVTYTTQGGSTPEPTTYTITVANDIANGSVTANPTSAAAGAEVTLTATPATGYEFGSWNVTNATTSAAITVTDNKFTMPAANVNVSATFNQVQQGGSDVPSGDYIFYESFDGCTGTGGNNGAWSGNIATTALTDQMYDNPGWTFITGYAADKCVRLGTGSALGSAETPAITATGSLTLIFKAGAWSGKSANLKLSATSATLDKSSVTMATNGSFTEYTVNITNATTGFKIKFQGNATKDSQFFLDEVKIVNAGSSTPEVTLSSISVKTNPTKVIYTEGETFNPAGLVITADYGTDGTEDVVYSGNESKFTFSPTLSTALTTSDNQMTITYGGKSTTQRITVNQIPSHTAHFSVNGTVDNTQDVTVKEGAAITFPSANPSVEGVVFMGWATASISGTTGNAPSMVSSATMGTTDVTYYAVFATADGNGPRTYTKATSLAVGDQVVFGLGEANGKPENGVTGANNGATISTNEAEWIVYTATTYDGKNGIVLQKEDGDYQRSANGNFDFTSNNPSTFTTNVYSHIIGYSFTLYSTPQGNKFYSARQDSYVEFLMWKVAGGISYSDYCTTVETSKVLSVSSVGWATFCPTFNVTIPSGVTVHGVSTYNETGVTFSTITDVIPAGTGVIVEANEGSYTFNATTEGNNNIGTNYLVGATTAVAYDENRTNAYIFMNGSNGVGFYRWDSGTLAAGKAYLQLPSANAPQFIWIADETTAVENVEAAQAVKFIENGVLYIRKNGRVYNAMGQFVK